MTDKEKIDRWIDMGGPLSGAGETLGVAIGGMDTPFSFVNQKSVLEIPGLFDLIAKPFNAMMKEDENKLSDA